MPFAKWNLEPVHVSRATAWPHYHHHHLLSRGNNGVTRVPTNGAQTHQLENEHKREVEGVLVTLPPYSFTLSGASQHSAPQPDAAQIGTQETHSSSEESEAAVTSCSTTSASACASSSSSASSSCSVSSAARQDILLHTHCRSLVGVIRQMAALLNATDQLFAEITDECRRLSERSASVRLRVAKLSGVLDRANAAIRVNAPRISGLLELVQVESNHQHVSYLEPKWQTLHRSPRDLHLAWCRSLGRALGDERSRLAFVSSRHPNCSVTGAEGSVCWQSQTLLEVQLFAPETRPPSVRALYGRAHAPGDLRLGGSSYVGSSNGASLPFGYPSPFVSMLRFRAKQQQPLREFATQLPAECCRCNCGRCHPQSQPQPLARVPPQAQQNISPSGQNSKEAGVSSGTQVTERALNETHKRNSSPCSLATWSSVAASSVFESITVPVASHSKAGKIGPLVRTNLLSSFSSADCENTENSDQSEQSEHQHQHQLTSSDEVGNESGEKHAIGGKTRLASTRTTIDDFFRENNVQVEQYARNAVQSKSSGPGSCTCSCSAMAPDGERIESRIDSCSGDQISRWRVSLQNAVAGDRSMAPSDERVSSSTEQDNYWSWWLSDDEHRRWSSALTSPLKPAMVDEQALWLRENIETRRPESVVFKSACDVPQHVLLQRALAPLCSMHSVQLRTSNGSKQTTMSEGEETDTMPELEPRLKRRWSLFPLRRHKQARKMAPSPLQGFSRFATLPQPSTEHTQQSDALEQQDGMESGAVHEVLLMSPEERVRLLAAQFSSPTVVPIDVSGKNFRRMSLTRRSLIHTDFRIPRHRIYGQYRSRSKSPVKGSGGGHEISPYAQSARLPSPRRDVAERACQTETQGQSDRVDNVVQVIAQVHNGWRQQTPDEHEQDYVMFLRAKAKLARQSAPSQSSSAQTCDSSRYNERSHLVRQVARASTLDSRQTITLRPRRPNPSQSQGPRASDTSQARRSAANGARSSSGNWSAATSDLTSTSSSPLQPLLAPRDAARKTANDCCERGKSLVSRKSLLAVANVALSAPLVPATGGGVSEPTPPANEEVESVYSVDNDGYYTSMHTDSGLFFGHGATPAEVSLAPLYQRSGATEDSNHRPEKQQQQKTCTRFEHIAEEDCKSISQHPLSGSNLSINSILSNSDATSVALGMPLGDDASHEPPLETNTSSLADFDCSVSHCSHRQLRHNSLPRHHRTLPAEKRQMSAAAMRRMIHSNHSNQSNHSNATARQPSQTAQVTIATTTTTCTSTTSTTPRSRAEQHTCLSMQSLQQSTSYRIEPPRGAYALSSCGSARCESVKRSASSVVQHQSPSKQRPAAASTSANSLRRQVSASGMTESSSASSSCRKLPPPPPPPRVSSMLRTLAQYRCGERRPRHHRLYSGPANEEPPSEADLDADVEDGADEDADLHSMLSIATSTSEVIRPHSLASNGPCELSSSVSTLPSRRQEHSRLGLAARRQMGSSCAHSESESNSEYLHLGAERRRRLFLSGGLVDSARSYPPLYVPLFSDERPSPTELSRPSSASSGTLFDDLFQLAPSQHNTNSESQTVSGASHRSEDTLCNASETSATPTATSSRTMTPTMCTNGDPEMRDARKSTSGEQAKMGTLERKQLEERHLSSPLPPPKLRSITRLETQTTSNNNSPPTSGASSQRAANTCASDSASSPPKPKPRGSLLISNNNTSFDSTPMDTFSKHTHTPASQMAKSEQTRGKTIAQDSPHSSPKSSKSVRIELASPPTGQRYSVSPNEDCRQMASTKMCSPTRRLTTEDLFIILHNSKKRHNIRTEPQIYGSGKSNQPSGSCSTTSASSTSGSPRTQPKVSSPNMSHSTASVPPVVSLKRRSWTLGTSSLSPSDKSTPTLGDANNVPNQARGRQSLALDRLGPLRPTTLTDFKRLLSQVRPPSSSSSVSSPSGGAGSMTPWATNSTSPTSSNAGAISPQGSIGTQSTYSALQALLKGSTISSPNQNEALTNSMSSSGISSASSALSGSPSPLPFSPTSAKVTDLSSPGSSLPSGSPARSGASPSPVVSPLSPGGATHDSMDSFIKKFSKSRLMSGPYANGAQSLAADCAGPSLARSAVSRLEAVGAKKTKANACPPIPEDPDGVSESEASTKLLAPSGLSLARPQETTQTPAVSKHNCTSTWV